MEKREEVQPQPPEANGHVAMRPGKRRRLDKSTAFKAWPDQTETVKMRYQGPEEGRSADSHAGVGRIPADTSGRSCEGSSGPENEFFTSDESEPLAAGSSRLPWALTRASSVQGARGAAAAADDPAGGK